VEKRSYTRHPELVKGRAAHKGKEVQMEIIILLVVVGGIAALVGLVVSANARAEYEATVTGRLAKYAGPNRDL